MIRLDRPDEGCKPGGTVPVTITTLRPRLNHMVCHACREGRHEECPAFVVDESASDAQLRRTWCDCQHQTPEPAEPATGAAGE